MTPASPRPSRNVILSYPKTTFLLKKGGKKENHMTEYDNMAGRVGQGLWSVIYMVGTDMTAYDNMTLLIPKSHFGPFSLGSIL
jgi:hypothetical protein